MPKVTYIDHDGASTTVEIALGENVMRGALNNGVEGIIGECGGGLACATCHVYVDPAWTERTGSSATQAERDMLESAACEVRAESRLSCQIELSEALDGLVVHLPERQY